MCILSMGLYTECSDHRGQKRGVRSLGTGVVGSYELADVGAGNNSSSLQEQCVLEIIK